MLTVEWDPRTMGLSFAGAVLSLVLGLGAVTGYFQFNLGLPFLFASALLGVAGWRGWDAEREKKAEAARQRARVDTLNGMLERQRKVLDDLADHLELAFFICDSRGKVLYANTQAKRLFRLEKYRDRGILALTLSHELETLVKQVEQNGDALGAELTFSYPSDWVGAAKVWAGSDGRIFLSIYEITELRRLERIRTDFVANVSHEMRTPMTIIRAMSETLLDDDDPDLKQRYLEKIISEVDRLSTISQDLLVLSAAESNPVRKQSCDLVGVVRDTLAQLLPKAESKGLALSYSGPERLPIAANSAQVVQVVLNLIDNAINYTPEGEITVKLCQDGDEAVFKVTDTGIGIEPEHESRIFERFYRIDKARSRFTGGTGLGLSIVKHIVEAHGGSISVQSVLNHGSTFTVRLPISAANS